MQSQVLIDQSRWVYAWRIINSAATELTCDSRGVIVDAEKKLGFSFSKFIIV